MNIGYKNEQFSTLILMVKLSLLTESKDLRKKEKEI